MITALLLLILKHFIVDAILQTPYQYQNKGKYGHMGGISHAALHGIGTLICFGYVGLSLEVSLWLGIVDTMLHYHIDYMKVKCSSEKFSKITRDREGKKCLCIYDNKYFVWLVLDQCLHFATYVLLVFVPLLQISGVS